MLHRAAVLLIALLPAMSWAQTSSSLAPRVRVETSQGAFVLELDTVRAPLSAENFLRYVRDGYYDGTVFHRVIANFVVQGGGYDAGLAERKAHAAIANESGNGLSNRRGSVGLARDESPHSGSSQFYINLMDNSALDPLPSRWGYAVFGRVVEGMEVVDRIAHTVTETVPGFGADVPVDRPVIQRAWVIEPGPATAPAEAPAAEAKSPE
ncbi:MAG: peptidylprolyl isomerase [Gammaproteobacteria bacterium]|nr:peptidylprolyl isomerase [Gammaproteobacteria bacterium]